MHMHTRLSTHSIACVLYGEKRLVARDCPGIIGKCASIFSCDHLMTVFDSIMGSVIGPASFLARTKEAQLVDVASSRTIKQ